MNAKLVVAVLCCLSTAAFASTPHDGSLLPFRQPPLEIASLSRASQPPDQTQQLVHTPPVKGNFYHSPPHLQIRHRRPDVPCCPGRNHLGGGDRDNPPLRVLAIKSAIATAPFL